MGTLFDSIEPTPTLAEIEPCDPCRRRHRGNANSVAAWERAKRSLGRRKRQILQALSEKPQTCEEVAAALRVPPNHISGRFLSLRTNGFIEEAGTRTTVRGTTATIWTVTEKGKELTDSRA